MYGSTDWPSAPPMSALVNGIHNVDAFELLEAMPDNSVNCIVTSPPYFGLRDYGVDGQLGLESSPTEFIDIMVRLFRECRRILREDGTCWVNIGDSYANDEKWGGSTGGKHANSLHGESGVGRGKKSTGMRPKSLMLIPFRLAIALQDDGWIVRSDIIWSKPNPMPESVTDRPTKAHEYVFLLTKSPRYWYDAEAIREPAVNGDPNPPRGSKGNEHVNSGRCKQDELGKRTYTGFNERWDNREPLTERNKRTVWNVVTEPTPHAHFATFPTKLIEPMILAGCPDKTCSVCGVPWIRIVEATGGTIGKGWTDHSADLEVGMSQVKHGGGVGNAKDSNGQSYTRTTVGFEPTCDCNADTVPGIVYDPFMGSGTTALVARRHGRNYIGSELNPEYAAIARERLRLPFDEHHVEPPKELPKDVEIKGVGTQYSMFKAVS